MTRLRLMVLAGLCVTAAGCVDGETTYTVNPDGSARLQFKIVTPKELGLFGPPPKKSAVEDPPADELVRSAIKPILETPGIAAWKDVSAEFLPNGKLKFSGTAYVKRLSDFTELKGVPKLGLGPVGASLTREPSGALKFVGTKDKENEPPRRASKSPEAIRKMTDAELDRHILNDLVELQSMRGLLIAALTDLKVKSTIQMPGAVTEAPGFTIKGNEAIREFDGNMILASINKILTTDPASLRKAYRSAKGPVPESLFIEGANPDMAAITVAKPGQALFDYDKEVKEAVAAYPDLRKKFGFGEDLQLPKGEAAGKFPFKK